MKKLIAILSVVFAMAFSAKAQDTFYPGWYFGIQGGANYVTSNYWGNISHAKHITPNASIDLGYDFTPWFGLRGSLSGPLGTYPTNGTTVSKYGYGQLGLDATFDILNMFRYKATRVINPYIFVGGAANYRFKVNNADPHFGVGVRGGLGFDFRLSELVDLSLELQDNLLGNKFNTLDDNKIFGGNILNWKKPFQWDDNFAALIGLKFNFGAVKARAAALAAAEAAAAEAAAKAAAAKAAADKAAAEKAAAEKAAAEKAAAEKAAAEKAAAEKAAAEAARAKARCTEQNVYFLIGKSVIRDCEMPKIEHIVNLMKTYPEAVVSVTGYADKYTGSAKRNMVLSKERAEHVAQALVDAGIAADRISTNYYGDTKQVSEVAEENRVSICVTR